MKIDSSMAQQAYAAYRTTTGSPKNATPSEQSAGTATSRQQQDTVELSEQSRQYAQALDATRNAPQTREDLVASLRAQVQNGTYSVDSQSLASAIAHRVDVRA